MLWIKVEDGLPEKPEVLAVTRGLAPDTGAACEVLGNAVLGALLRVWLWADKNTDSGFINGATLSDVDRVAALPGLAVQLVRCGWLVENPVGKPVGILFVNFQRHMGISAKRRAMHARAQEKYRNKR